MMNLSYELWSLMPMFIALGLFIGDTVTADHIFFTLSLSAAA